jgi:DNA-binding SARP family transcriptional activator/DNA-binding XRE family transcriptional regulator
MERQVSGPSSGFADVVRAYRHKAGLTQRELATRAGLSVAAIRDLEQGRRVRPRRGSLAALARALSLDPEQAADLTRAMSVPRRRVDNTGFADIADAAGPPVTPRLDLPDPVRPAWGLWLAILGPLEVWRDGVPLSLGPPARRAVLGMLAVNPGTLMRRDTFIDVLWGREPPSTAVSLLQAHISRLRKLMSRERSASGGGEIASHGGAYRLQLQLPHEQLDLLVFKKLAARAAAAEADGDHLTACDLYAQAIGLWRDDPLADIELLRDLPDVAALRRQLVDAQLGYADVACVLGRHHEVLPRLQALAASEPLNEAVYARLMIALAGTGQQAAAIHVYENLRLRLDHDLGVYPGRELVEAHLRVLHQDIPAVPPGRAHVYCPASAAAEHVVPRQLPVAPWHFTGRSCELNILSGLSDSGRRADAVVIAALTGMAGIGKTALAVYWAHQIADQFPDGQLFTDLRGFSPSGIPVTPTEVLCSFLSALGVPADRIPACLAEQAALYRSLLADRRMLVVLDNAQDAEQVRPLLPGSPGCLVLVTSRNRLTGLAAAEGARLLNLGVLTDAESGSLLARSLGCERAMAEPAAVTELIALCAGLPLALCGVAARAVTRPGLPLAALAAEMRDEWQRLDVIETGEMATSVRMVFSWSVARLSEPATRMFRYLGLHPGPDITVPAAMSLAALPRSAACLALAELCDQNLVTEHAAGRYVCHDLLRAYAAETARTCSGAQRHAPVSRVLDHYLHTAKSALTLLYPHLTYLMPGQPQPGVLPEEIDNPEQAAEWLESERHVLLAVIGLVADQEYYLHAWELLLTVWLFFTGRAYRKEAGDERLRTPAEDLIRAPMQPQPPASESLIAAEYCRHSHWFQCRKDDVPGFAGCASGC